MQQTAYSTDGEGKFIPASQRPDGTWRKARRVKEGYVPQEEVPLYESKGKQFAQRKSSLPPGVCSQGVETAKKEREKQERIKAKKETTKASVNKKQRQPTPGVLVLPSSSKLTAGGQKGNINTNDTSNSTSSNNTNAAVEKLSKDLQATLKLQEDSQELTKKLKKLRKKLREIETIEEKMNSGELKKPEKDQMEKVKRKKDIIKEMKELDYEEGRKRHGNGNGRIQMNGVV